MMTNNIKVDLEADMLIQRRLMAGRVKSPSRSFTDAIEARTIFQSNATKIH